MWKIKKSHSDHHVLPATRSQHIQLKNNESTTQQCRKILQVIQPQSKQTNIQERSRNTGMHVRSVHTKQSDPINSGHYIQQETLHNWFTNPHRNKSGRMAKMSNFRHQKHQPVTYASLHTYSEFYLCPATVVQPAQINKISPKGCVHAHMMEINSGRQNLPDVNSRVLVFTSVHQKYYPHVIRPISEGCQNPAKMTQGSQRNMTPTVGSSIM